MTTPKRDRPETAQRLTEWVADTERFLPGNTACPGCGAALAMRHVVKELGERTIVVVPACCWAIIAGQFPYASLAVPSINTPFACAAAVASGIRAALDARKVKDTTVMAWAGDGGTFDIGLQAMSGAFERNDDLLYVCYDNEAYMNTGVQRSSATPLGAWTTTTPVPHVKDRPKKDLLDIVAAHRIPYAATASIAFVDDLRRKVRRAKETKGARFLHILCPCSPGWKTQTGHTVKLARLAVHTKIMPLFEVEDGLEYTVNVEPDGTPVEEFLKLQGRFRHLSADEIARVQAQVDRTWAALCRRAGRAR